MLRRVTPRVRSWMILGVSGLVDHLLRSLGTQFCIGVPSFRVWSSGLSEVDMLVAYILALKVVRKDSRSQQLPRRTKLSRDLPT